MRHEKSLMIGGMLVASLCGGMLAALLFGAPARLTLGVVQQAVVVNFSDASQTRLVMGVADNGRPSITFLNADGEVVQELP